jgi:hypothetical protein
MPIRKALRGPEAKGVDIVNFWLYENLDGVPHKHEWWRCMNTFEYDFAYDLDSMLLGDHISNLRRVMQRCAKIGPTTRLNANFSEGDVRERDVLRFIRLTKRAPPWAPGSAKLP